MRLLLINPSVLAVDSYQVDVYAEAFPFGMMQIATLLRRQGHEVRSIDMMGYLDGGFDRIFTPENRYADLPCGDNTLRGVTRPVYLYGRNFDSLRRRLDEEPPPDEVLVTCCLSFNYEPAHRVIRECRRAFPKARVRLGGFYASTYTDHARASGADEVFAGRWAEADATPADFDAWERPPKVWLFRLVSGCVYKCSFCLNAATPATVVAEPRSVAASLRRLHREFGVREFSNWDPNVMLQRKALNTFLDEMASYRLPVGLKWEMGIQPNLLNRETAVLMREAGTIAMSIPFESSDPEMMARFNKSSRIGHALQALATAAEAGFDRSRFHCCFIIGVPGEQARHLFRTHLLILRHGGNPKPFPITPSPGSLEYERHAHLLRGKDHQELNGHLWPLLGSAQAVETYETILKVVSSNNLDLARRRAAALPERERELFEEEVAAIFDGRAAGFPVTPAAPPPARLPPGRAGALAQPPLLALPRGLHALCLTCVERDFCVEKGAPMDPAAPACRRERRGVDLAALARLFAEIRGRVGLPEAGFADHETRLWRHLEIVQRTAANTFEPSASWNGARWGFYRYSHSFHDARPAEWAADVATLREWLTLLDPAAARAAVTLPDAVHPPLARQLLFGVDAQPGAPPRLKVYFRLCAGQPTAKRRMVDHLLAGAVPSALAEEAPRLHLVGFDLGPAGVSAMKLYFRHDAIPPDELAARAGSVPPLAALDAVRGSNAAPWRDVVLVARVRAGEPPAGARITQVDLHAGINDLTLGDLAAAWRDVPGAPPLDDIASLFARFPLALNRVSLPAADAVAAGGGGRDAWAGTNLYYLLAS